MNVKLVTLENNAKTVRPTALRSKIILVGKLGRTQARCTALVTNAISSGLLFLLGQHDSMESHRSGTLLMSCSPHAVHSLQSIFYTDRTERNLNIPYVSDN